MKAYFFVLLCTIVIVQGRQFFLSPNGQSVICTMADPCSDISLAMSQVESGDELIFLQGTFYANQTIAVSQSISLTSLGSVTFNLNQTVGPLFAFNGNISSSVNGLTFYNGNGDLGGAILATNFSYVTVNNCTFQNNTANDGGGIYITTSANVQVSNSLFINNRASNGGGAISIEEIGYATLTNLKFVDNTADDGGALYILNGLVNGTNLNFIDNHAEDEGGSLYSNSQSHISFTETQFTGSSSHSSGGAAYVRTSYFACTNCYASHCVSPNGGTFASDNYGGVHLYSTSVFNSSSLHGGVVYVANSRFNAIKSYFQYNNALSQGGAIFVTDEGKVTVNGTQVVMNTAGVAGGAIFAQSSSSVTIVDSVIEANYAETDGGGLSCSDSKFFIQETVLRNNSVSDKTDGNIFCSAYPVSSYCQFAGDSSYPAICGEQGEASSLRGKLPTIAVVGIVLAGTALVGVLVVGILCVVWKRRQAFDKKGAYGAVKKPSEMEDLVEDYD